MDLQLLPYIVVNNPNIKKVRLTANGLPAVCAWRLWHTAPPSAT